MTLQPGWLQRQLDQVNADIATWPAWMRREAGFMTHLQRMDRPISITLTDGDWCVIQGLLTKEWSSVKAECFDPAHEGRKPYIETLERLRQMIIRKTE